MSNMENDISPRQSPMEILGLDWGWVGNKGGLDWRIRHGYDSTCTYLTKSAETSI